MNIFVLDSNPKIAAEQHCDKHVVKMLLETVQLLSTARVEHGESAPYKATHRKHPCTIWAAKSKENYSWLVALGMALAEEYTKRFGKSHLSGRRLLEIIDPPASMPSIGLTPFAQAMPEQYKKDGDAVAAYRAYYLGEKTRFAKWAKGSDTPAWWFADAA
jgi:hypothetical protein